ncbi:MAG: hypothetical protein R6V40_04180 [Candidatus Moraniibacteriota bacterium]
MENNKGKEGVKNKIKQMWQKPFIASIAVFVFFFGLISFFYLQAPGTLAIGDQYFHFRLADMIKERGLSSMNDFDWIYFSEQRAEGEPRKVQLFNIFQIPFTFFEDDFLGLKISAIFWASLTLSALYYLLRKFRVPYAFIFILLLFSSYAIIFRLLINRSLVLIMSLIFVEIYLAVRQKHKSFLFISFFHALWHLATFPAPILIALVVETIRYILNKKFLFKPILLGIIAVFAGLAVYPQFPNNVTSSLSGVFSINKNIVSENSISNVEGKELKLLDPKTLIENFSVITFISILSIVYFIYFYLGVRNKIFENNYKYKQEDHFFFVSFLVLIGSLSGILILSGRFFDFFVVSAILTFALTVKKIMENKDIVIKKNYKNYALVGVFIFVLFLSQNELTDVKKSAYNKELNTKKQVAHWIKENSREGDIVFVQSWNHFPIQFFFNQRVRYTMGLEPMALKKHSDELFWKWYNIRMYDYYCEQEKDCRKEVKLKKQALKEKPSHAEYFNKENFTKITKSVKNDFKSKFILSSDGSFNELMLNNKESFEKHKVFEGQTDNKFFIGKLE